MGGRLARPRRGQRHRPGQRDGPRDHRRRPREPRVHRAGDVRLPGLQGQGRVVHARVRGGGDRRPGRGHPRACPRLRQGAARDDLLDAGHHRAPQRGRQRPGPDQPGPPDGPRRPLRQRRQPVAWPEQRPGRRRHGRAPRPPAGVPARRERRAPGKVRCRVGRGRPAESRLAPVGHVRRDRARRPDSGLLHRREPGPVRGRPEARDPPAREPRVPRRAGPLPDEDRGAGRRGPPGDGGLGGERGHRHQLRAPRPAGAQGGRAAGRRARRPGHRLRPRQPHGRCVGRPGPGGCLGRGPAAVPGPCRDELRPPRVRGRAPVAVLRPRSSR